MFKRPTRFAASRDGNFAVVTALAMLPITLAIGGAMEMSMASSDAGKVQAAVDAAVLAGSRAAAGSEVSTAKMFFAANSATPGLTIDKANFVLDNQGNLTGDISGKRPSSFLGMAGISSTGIVAAATAALPKISKITFTPTQAQGWYAKDIFVYTKDKAGKITMSKKVISYDYDQKTAKKTISPSLNSASQTYDLGTDYATFGVGMVVWPNITGARTGPSLTYYSDAANAALLLRVSGNCRPTQQNNWEDGGNADYQDFVYTLTCATESGRLRIAQ